MSQTAADLRAAADHIDKVGLNQDGNYFARPGDETPRSQKPCCTLGAIGIITGEFQDVGLFRLPAEDDDGHERYYAAYWALQEHLSSTTARGITTWSDDATGAGEVTHTLRVVADKIEADA